MSTAPDAPSAETPSEWPVLSMLERRVLGVLAEKQKTTPDIYPLSRNACLTGCNQKSNRDPVMNLTEDDVEDGLTRAQQKGLAIRLTGSGRVEKWRHALYEAWHVDKVELAVLTELLLRGPQTEGELRSRVSRMEPIEDLEALRGMLHRLAERRLVVYLTPEGRRGTSVTHGFHAPEELDHLRKAQPAEAAAPSGHAAPPRASDDTIRTLEAGLIDARAEVAQLRSTVTELQATVTDLTGQLRQIKESLGL